MKDKFQSAVKGDTGRAAIAFADQSINAAVGLAASIVAARVGGVSGLGVYSIYLSAAMLARQITTGALVEAFPVIHEDTALDRRRAYVLTYLFAAALFAVFLGMTIGLLFFIANYTQNWTDEAYVAGGIYAFTTSLLLVIKRVQYSQDKMIRSLLQGCIYALVVLIAIIVLWDALSISSLITAMNCAGLLIIAWNVWDCLFAMKGVRNWKLGPQFRDHIVLGRWNLAASPLQWAYNGGFFLLIGSVLGTQAVGMLRVFDLLLMPFKHFVTSTYSVLLVSAARHRKLHEAGFPSWARNKVIFMGTVSVVYGIAFFSCGPLIASKLMGIHIGDFLLLSIFAVVPLVEGINVVFSAWLIASRQSRLRLISFGLPVVLGWPATVILSDLYDVAGGAMGWAVTLTLHTMLTVTFTSIRANSVAR